MKRWMLTTLITGGTMIVMGLGLTAVGAAVGVKTIGSFDEFYLWENNMNEFSQNTQPTSINGSSREAKSYSLEAFDTLEVDIDAGTMEIIEGNEWSLEIERVDSKYFNYENKNKKLKIDYNLGRKKNLFNWKSWKNNNRDEKFLLTVPKGTKLEEMDLEFGITHIGVNGLTIKEVDISSGVGEIILENCTIEDLSVNGGVGQIIGNGLKVTKSTTINSGVGEIILEGEFKGNIEIDGGVGSVQLNMENCTEDDYNYTVDQGMGSVIIGENSKGDFGGSWNKNTTTAKNNIDVQGGLGEVIISFNP